MNTEPNSFNCNLIAMAKQLIDKAKTCDLGLNLLLSICDLFSAWLSMSFENHSLNSSWSSNKVGMMK